MRISLELRLGAEPYRQETGLELRYQGINGDHLAWMLTHLDRRIDLAPDEADYRLHRDYQQRAQLRFAAGFEIGEVCADLRWAARCIVGDPAMHFRELPPERFRSRRVEPVELAAAAGDSYLALRVAERFGVPLSMLVAGLADADLTREMRVVTRLFDGPAEDVFDVAGLGAIAWSAGLAALIRGFDDEALLAVRCFYEAVEASAYRDAKDEPLLRYQGLMGLLRLAVDGEVSRVAEALQVMLSAYEGRLRTSITEDEWREPPAALRYFDLSLCALGGVLAMRGHSMEPGAFTGGAERFGSLIGFQLVQEEEEVDVGVVEGAEQEKT